MPYNTLPPVTTCEYCARDNYLDGRESCLSCGAPLRLKAEGVRVQDYYPNWGAAASFALWPYSGAASTGIYVRREYYSASG